MHKKSKAKSKIPRLSDKKNVAASHNSAIKCYIFAVLTSLVTGIYKGFLGLMKYVENLSQPGLLLGI